MKKRNQDSGQCQGQAMILVMILMAILGVASLIIMGRGQMSSQSARFGRVTAESNILESAVKQVVNNPSLCANTLGQPNAVPSPFPTPSAASSPVPISLGASIAQAGMYSNGVMVQTVELVTVPASFVAYGQQAAGPYAGYYCWSGINLHIVSTRSSMPSPTPSASSVGSFGGVGTTVMDTPIFFLTDFQGDYACEASSLNATFCQ